MKISDILFENNQEELYYKDPELIKQIMDRYNLMGENNNQYSPVEYSINPDGSVSLHNSAGRFNYFMVNMEIARPIMAPYNPTPDKIKIKFKDTANYTILSEWQEISDFSFLPKNVESLSIKSSKPDFSTLPNSYVDELSIARIGTLSLVGLEKTVREFTGKGHIMINSSTEQGGIGLMKIRGLREVSIMYGKDGDRPIYRFLDILNRHLSGERDIISCKRELISSGLKEYAKS